MNKYVVVTAFLTATLASGVFTYMKIRGIRNNNPGNIRHGANWEGMKETQTDKSFVQFIKPEYGIRAIARIIKNYKIKYGINTVAGIISRWAPQNENDTEAYINAVAKSLDVNKNARLNLETALPKLISAIIKHENGINPYSMTTIQKGIELESA